MGASFIATTVTAWRGRLRAELEAGLERAKAIKAVDELPDEFYGQYVGEEGPWDDDDQEIVDAFMTEVRGGLVSAFEEVLDDYDNETQSCHFILGTKEIMFTGGMSWGDPPTEISDAMSKVLACDLYWGDRLTPNQRALKQRIIDNVKAAKPKYAEWLQENLDDLIHQLESEHASSINNEGWEGQLDHLFEYYRDSVRDFLNEYLGEEETNKLAG